MMPAAFILGLYFIGVSLEHYHESNMWHNYYVTEVKIPTPSQETEQVSPKLHEKAFQDQVERQDHNIHLRHTVISVLYAATNTFFVYCACLVNIKKFFKTNDLKARLLRKSNLMNNETRFDSAHKMLKFDKCA